MICFQRDGTTQVPGCSGTGISDDDYCVIRLPNMLVMVGDNGVPESAFHSRSVKVIVTSTKTVSLIWFVNYEMIERTSRIVLARDHKESIIAVVYLSPRRHQALLQ